MTLPMQEPIRSMALLHLRLVSPAVFCADQENMRGAARCQYRDSRMEEV